MTTPGAAAVEMGVGVGGLRGASSLPRDEVLRGLRATPKALSPKWFYDAAGARFFERITSLDEYYLTRTELAILRARASEIAAAAGPGAILIEYGSGAGIKVRLLLDALDRPAAYIPVDISREQLVRVAAGLAADYPTVAVEPVCADYTRPFPLPSLPPDAYRLGFFPGSTIGNFHPAEAADFLRGVRRAVGGTGSLVLGADRTKDVHVLEAAYADAQGVTAAFNLNLLTRVNRELGADFDLSQFRHRAFFNAAASRIEMHLEARQATTVCVAGEPISFQRGETIWTESSYKYDRERLECLAATSGFRVERLWTDADNLFWVGVLGAL
jgi:L-histidine Nalpha-methyltransferase